MLLGQILNPAASSRGIVLPSHMPLRQWSNRIRVHILARIRLRADFPLLSGGALYRLVAPLTWIPLFGKDTVSSRIIPRPFLNIKFK